MTKSVGTPVCPRARTLRAVLRKAGMECLVRQVTSGRRSTHIRITYEAPAGTAEKIADAIRPLWMDGVTRVRVVYAGLVVINRERWYRVYPDTPDGRAAHAEKEQERTRQLLQAAECGKTLYVAGGEPDGYHQPVYQPTGDDPFRPWLVQETGRRYPSTTVYANADA